jgi:Type II secretion system (T2SS), protein E, N-terminal domain
VTVELARRLIESGVPLADIEAALLLVVERGLSLPEALAERDAGLLSRVEQELARSELPSVMTVRASPELFARLPVGMCRRLLAVPVHVDPRTGRVDVAAVEPLDPHIGQEFTYHLDQPVRVLHASHEAVKAALDRLQHGAKVSVLPPQRPLGRTLGSDAPIPLIKLDNGVRSDAPIPLIRRSMLPVRAPSAVPAARSAPPPSLLPEADSVALSWRSKPPPVDLVAGAAELDKQAARAPSVPPPAEANPASTRERLEDASSPEAVLELLRDCLAPAASIVFAVKNASFDGRVASPAIERRTSVKQISLLSHQPSVLETAVKSGFYLGPIPNTPNHRELREALPPDAVNEVYVTVITVSDRASLVWLLAGFEQSLDLTRRADEIALVAGRALARILRDRKRGN